MNTSEILSEVSPEKRAQAEAFLKHRDAVSVPFLVRAMLFIGSLISAGLLVWIADRLLAGIIPVLGRGVLFMAVGFLLGKTADKLPPVRGAWRRQLGGLIGLAGQIMLASRMTDIPGVSVWMGVLAVAVVSYPLFKNPFNRFLWCAVAASSLYAQVDWEWKWPLFAVALSAFCAFGAALWLFAKRKFNWYPLAYALIWWSVICAGETADSKMCWYGLNPASAVLAGSVALYGVFSHKGNWTRGQIAFAAGAIVLSALLNWPTVLALILMYTGFTLRDRVLESIGTAGVVCGLFLFYFTLNVALSTKAALLVASGLILLALRRMYAK
ncbi:DUF4401 domain-containing protein [Candidatus Avelusimicrobium sp.]|uniref:DUF4401 domain-containing protein n=1 Tax=Candidatus Avelusimicrobium sp. TaxID=3048833 RepID=UPI003D7E3CCC